METMGPTLARIPMLSGIFLLQIQIYGKPNFFGWIIRLIYLYIYIIGRIWKEMELTWERKSHFGDSETLRLDSLDL